MTLRLRSLWTKFISLLTEERDAVFDRIKLGFTKNEFILWLKEIFKDWIIQTELFALQFLIFIYKEQIFLERSTVVAELIREHAVKWERRKIGDSSLIFLFHIKIILELLLKLLNRKLKFKLCIFSKILKIIIRLMR